MDGAVEAVGEARGGDAAIRRDGHGSASARAELVARAREAGRRRLPGPAWDLAGEVDRLAEEARRERGALRVLAEGAALLARAEGLRQGREAGLASLAGALEALASAREEALALLRRSAGELGVAVARRILARELRADPAAVSAAVEEALEAAGAQRQVRLRLHPAAAAALQGTLRRSGRGEPVALEADPALAPGDVWLEAEGGTVDGRLERRLEAVGRFLAGAA